MTNPQGTQWESALVKMAQEHCLQAGRFPKMASADEADVWIGHPSPRTRVGAAIPVVAWRRLVGVKANGRRKPDGEKEVVILRVDDFLRMVAELNRISTHMTFMVQCKWTTNLNVTRTLGGLRSWLRGRLEPE